MSIQRLCAALALLSGLGLGACDDYTGGRPADMGAGRPESETSAEVPAAEVLPNTGKGPLANPDALGDTTRVPDPDPNGNR